MAARPARDDPPLDGVGTGAMAVWRMLSPHEHSNTGDREFADRDTAWSAPGVGSVQGRYD